MVEPALRERVQKAYPYPIAVPYARLLELEDQDASAAERFEALVGLFEGLLRTLTLLAFSAYVERGPRDDDLDAALRETFFGKSLSLGDWSSLLAKLLRHYRKRRAECALPVLVDLWFRPSGKTTPEARALQAFVGVRNNWAHLKLPAEQRDTALEGYRPTFDAILEILAPLAETPIYVPQLAEAQGEQLRVTEAVRCAGTELELVDTDLVLPPPLQLGDELIVVLPDGPLRLFPLVLAEELDDGDDDLVVYERNRRASGDPRRVVRVDYVGVESRAGFRIDERSAAAPRVLQAFSRRLEPWLAPAPDALDLAARPLFPHMGARVERAAVACLGRAGFLERVREHAREAAEAGRLLLVVAPPGGGKTTALCAAAAELSAAVHLCGPESGRDQSGLAARSLLGQLIAAHRVQRAVPEEAGAAILGLHSLLRELGQSSGSGVTVVLDALDELRLGPDGEPDVSLVPNPVPPGVLVIVSVRPGDVSDRLAGLPGAQVLELGGLSELDMLAAARQLAPDQPEDALRAACARAAGNPLFLRTLLLAPGKELPHDVEHAFQRALDRVAAGFLSVDVARVLGLLSVSRSGLARRDLGRLLGVPPFGLGRLLRALRPWFVRTGDTYQLFHARLREWAQRELVGDDYARTHHGELADLLAEGVTVGREASLRDLPYHLEQAGRGGELLDLLDGPFLARKAAVLTSVEAVRDDLLRGVRAAAPDVVRAARYGLVAALLTRCARGLLRCGAVEALARHGDPRLAASLARSVPEPRERNDALARVARQLAVREASEGGLARALCAEIDDRQLREGVLAALGTPPPLPPVRGGDRPEERARRAAAEALRAEPGQAGAQVVEAVRLALEASDRALVVRACVAAAAHVPADLARELATRAVLAAVQEPSRTEAPLLVAESLRALGRVDQGAAQAIAERRPPGVERARALAAAGAVSAALEEARTLPTGRERDAAFAEALGVLVEEDAEAAARQARRELPAGADRDRILDRAAALLEGVSALEAARAIGDPALRAAALARAGAGDEADAVAEGVLDPRIRASAYERMASAAPQQAARYLQLAEQARSALQGDERAAALREAAALEASSSARLARAKLDAAAALDTSYAARRETLLRRARLLLTRPSGTALLDAVRLSACFGDAFADLFPDAVGAISAAFGEVDPQVVSLAVASLDAASAQVVAVVTACLDVEPVELAPPPALSPEQAGRVGAARWDADGREGAERAAEADRLQGLVTRGEASERDVDRLTEVLLELGDRTAAVGALLTYAEQRSLAGDATAAAAVQARAADLDPLDPRVEATLRDREEARQAAKEAEKTRALQEETPAESEVFAKRVAPPRASARKRSAAPKGSAPPPASASPPASAPPPAAPTPPASIPMPPAAPAPLPPAPPKLPGGMANEVRARSFDALEDDTAPSAPRLLGGAAFGAPAAAGGGGDPFTGEPFGGAPAAGDPFAEAAADPFGGDAFAPAAEDPFAGGGADPFAASPPAADPFSAPAGADPFGAPPPEDSFREPPAQAAETYDPYDSGSGDLMMSARARTPLEDFDEDLLDLEDETLAGEATGEVVWDGPADFAAGLPSPSSLPAPAPEPPASSSRTGGGAPIQPASFRLGGTLGVGPDSDDDDVEDLRRFSSSTMSVSREELSEPEKLSASRPRKKKAMRSAAPQSTVGGAPAAKGGGAWRWAIAVLVLALIAAAVVVFVLKGL